MRSRTLAGAAATLLVVLGGCAGRIMPGAASTTNVVASTSAGNVTGSRSTAVSGSPGALDLVGRTFLSTAVSGHALADGTRITVSVSDRSLAANAGCNTISGLVTVAGNRLRVSNVGMSEIGCPSALAEQDSWLAGFLSADPTWQLSGDDLTLRSGAVTVKLTDKRVADPDLPIDGTTWELTGLIDGDVASTVPAGSKVIHLELDETTLRLWNDCVDISGNYTITDGTLAASLAIPPVTSTCEVASIAMAVVVLKQGAAATVDSDQLQLVAPDGRGLMLSAIGAGTNPPISSGDAPTSATPKPGGTGDAPTTGAVPTGGSASTSNPVAKPASNPLAGRTFVLTRLLTDAGGVDTKFPDASFRITFGEHDAEAVSPCGEHHYSTVTIGKREGLGLAVDLGMPNGQECPLGTDPSGLPAGLLYFGKAADGGYYLTTGFVAWYFDEVTR